MGLSALGDEYCLCRDMELHGIKNCVKVIDDALLYDDDLSTHLHQIQQTLTRCHGSGITINKEISHGQSP